MNTLAREAVASETNTPTDLEALISGSAQPDAHAQSIAQWLQAYPLSPNTKGFVAATLFTAGLAFVGLSVASQETNGLWPFGAITLAMAVDYALRNL